MPDYLQALLEELSGSPDPRPFRKLVEPLEKHDRERNSDLVRTLEVFFAGEPTPARRQTGCCCGATASPTVWSARGS